SQPPHFPRISMHNVPAPVSLAVKFVYISNEDRRNGGIDVAQTIAVKAACRVIAEYMAIVLDGLKAGEFSHRTREEIRELMEAIDDESVSGNSPDCCREGSGQGQSGGSHEEGGSQAG